MEFEVAEAERVKPRAMYVEEAIQLALDSRWSEAAAINRTILDHYGPDEDAYNRLGKALYELGQLQEALDAYSETLKLNPLNLIAQKNTRKLTAQLEAPSRVEGQASAIDVDLFTEEPGKSGLSVLAPPSGGVTITVAPGDAVELEPRGTALAARTVRGVELGEVEAKLKRRLLPLMAAGNRYAAAVARVEDQRIEIMIRETYQSPENARKSSFPIARGSRREEFRPYAKESLLGERGSDLDLELAGEEDSFNVPGGGDEPEEELDGMQTVGEDLDEAGGFEVEEEPEDEDERPEDNY